MPRKPKKPPITSAEGIPVELSPLPEIPAVKAIIAAKEAADSGPQWLPQFINGRRVNPPTPDGFREGAVFNLAGIRVNMSLDGNSVAKTVAIQFADDRPPSRAEKDILEAIHESKDEIRDRIKFTYDTDRKQWQRVSNGQPGANLLDAKRLAADLAEARIGRQR